MEIQNFKQNVILAPYTTYKIGGPARYFISVKSENDLLEALRWALDHQEKYFILGGGSNILVADEGFDGLVVKLEAEIIVEKLRIKCGAGAPLALVLKKAVDHSLSGLEWSAGIPGATVGGALRGNAEAFNQSMSNIVASVRVLDVNTWKFENFSHADCQFSYRHSIFKDKPNYVLWSLVLKMKRESAEKSNELVRKSIEFRQKNYPKEIGVGSIFKNVSVETVQEVCPKLLEIYHQKGKIVRLNNIGAGFIIEELGFKGKKIGGAKVSEAHANHIVNTGNATAKDVITLISLIKQKVRDNFGIQLVEEIQYVGF
jgi:UDP-N-acetylmuramate dehydrogenase